MKLNFCTSLVAVRSRDFADLFSGFQFDNFFSNHIIVVYNNPTSSVLKTCSTVALSGRTDLVLDTSNLSYRFLVRTSAPPPRYSCIGLADLNTINFITKYLSIYPLSYVICYSQLCSLADLMHSAEHELYRRHRSATGRYSARRFS